MNKTINKWEPCEWNKSDFCLAREEQWSSKSAWALPGSLLELQILRPHPNSPEPKSLWENTANCASKSPAGNFGASSSQNQWERWGKSRAMTDPRCKEVGVLGRHHSNSLKLPRGWLLFHLAEWEWFLFFLAKLSESLSGCSGCPSMITSGHLYIWGLLCLRIWLFWILARQTWAGPPSHWNTCVKKPVRGVHF